MNIELKTTVPEEEGSRLTLIKTRLHTPVIGDILDELGYRNQMLPPEIRPLRTDMVLAGRAMPVLIARVYAPQKRPFGLMTEALDQLQPGEIYLAGNAGALCAAWGEIMTVTAEMRGATGAVIDGYHRDTRRVLEEDFPVFSHGGYAQDARIRSIVLDYRVPIEIGRVRVNPGDLLFGDVDGVVAVPADIEEEVIGRALAKTATENHVRASIRGGSSSSEAFARYDVL